MLAVNNKSNPEPKIEKCQEEKCSNVFRTNSLRLSEESKPAEKEKYSKLNQQQQR